jgi:Protein of unknown function (DUF3095)
VAVVASGDSTFYERLEPFADFAAVADARHYVEAPDDWLVVVADIKGSTEAARTGRYKDVNLIGAACITAVLNVTRGLELPFVFGGDGATLLIPSAARAAVAPALIRTRRLAARVFGLELRLGMVPVEEVRRRGRRVLVAKFALSPGNHLAMFAGGGLELVDRLIKEGAGFGLEDETDPGAPDLNGLSCRWQPFRSLRGHMLTLLVQAREVDDLPLQQEIIEALRRILDDTPARAAPVQPANMRFAWPPAGLEAEARLTRGRASLWRRRAWLYFESFLQSMAERFDLRIGPYNAPVYREEVLRNSDYRMVADTLRMVLDCTDEQTVQIESYLDGLRAQGRITYGLHRADRALMTCLVFSLEEGRHVHFVDGADGGYALAALQLKAQLRSDVDHVGDRPEGQTSTSG